MDFQQPEEMESYQYHHHRSAAAAAAAYQGYHQYTTGTGDHLKVGIELDFTSLRVLEG